MPTLTVTEDFWQLLLDEARASLDHGNARAVGSYAGHEHELKVEDSGEIVLATAIQLCPPSKYGGERQRTVHRLAWRKSDGALLKVKVKRQGKMLQNYGQTITAKNWHAAAAKSPKHLLEIARLVDFIMIGDVYHAGTSTIGGPEP